MFKDRCTQNEERELIARCLKTVGEIKCFEVIARKTWGWNKKSDIISHSQFVHETELSKHTVIDSIKGIKDKGIVIVHKIGQWYQFEISVEGIRNLLKSSAKIAPVKKRSSAKIAPVEVDEVVQSVIESSAINASEVVQKLHPQYLNNNINLNNDANTPARDAFSQEPFFKTEGVKNTHRPVGEFTPLATDLTKIKTLEDFQRMAASSPHDFIPDKNPDPATPIVVPPIPQPPPVNVEPIRPWEKPLSDDEKIMLDGLTRHGIDGSQARKLIAEFDPKIIQNQIAWMEHRRTENPAAYLISAIKKNYGPPKPVVQLQESVQVQAEIAEQEDRLAEIREQARKATHVISPKGNYFTLQLSGNSVTLLNGKGLPTHCSLSALEQWTFV